MKTQLAHTHDFADSLPVEYRQRFSERVVAAHASIAADRGTVPATVGVFEDDLGAPALCIVAEDRPGMLALVSEALRRSGFDVVDAEAFTRRTSGPIDEAVDFFWLQRRGGPEPVTAKDAEHIRNTLIHLILHGLPTEPEAPAPQRRVQDGGTRVRFLEDSDGSLCTLELETSDASGLLRVITAALFAERVQITRSEVKTRSGRVFDRFSITELDGSSISTARRLGIQVAVISAIEHG